MHSDVVEGVIAAIGAGWHALPVQQGQETKIGIQAQDWQQRTPL